MVDIAINLETVRELDESLTGVLDRVAAAGFDGVQFADSYSLPGNDPAAIAGRLGGLDLAPLPPRLGIDKLRSDLGSIIPAFGALGTRSAVLTQLDSARFSSANAVDATADEMNEIAANLDEWGWNLLYHNTGNEYVDLGREWAFDRFLEQTSMHLQLDVGSISAAGDDPAARIRQLGDRVGHIQLNDVRSGERSHATEIGQGDVDMDECVAAARDVDAAWLIYNHDAPQDPAVSIETGAAFLQRI